MESVRDRKIREAVEFFSRIKVGNSSFIGISGSVSYEPREEDFAVMSRFVNGSQIYNRNPYREYATSLAISLCHWIVPQTRKFKDSG